MTTIDNLSEQFLNLSNLVSSSITALTQLRAVLYEAKEQEKREQYKKMIQRHKK